jgi:predicted nucleic acid-binding protein
VTGFLLDTNVPSELTRPQSDPHVEDWLDAIDDEQLFLSVVSLGEMLKGLTVLPASKRRQELQQWIDDTLRPWFDGRILPVTAHRRTLGRSRGRMPASGEGPVNGGRLDPRYGPGARPHDCDA